MDAFEYLSVLISIILGLGITNLLQGFARWIERRETYAPHGPSIAWAAMLLLSHVQTWWSMFALRRWESWDFLQFATVLMQPIVLYLLAAIVFPSAEARYQDLRENFAHQRRWFFGLILGLLAVSVLRDVVRDHLPEAANLAFHGAWAALAVVGLLCAGERVQRALAYVALASGIAYTALLFARLQ